MLAHPSTRSTLLSILSHFAWGAGVTLTCVARSDTATWGRSHSPKPASFPHLHGKTSRPQGQPDGGKTNVGQLPRRPGPPQPSQLRVTCVWCGPRGCSGVTSHPAPSPGTTTQPVIVSTGADKGHTWPRGQPGEAHAAKPAPDTRWRVRVPHAEAAGTEPLALVPTQTRHLCPAHTRLWGSNKLQLATTQFGFP